MYVTFIFGWTCIHSAHGTLVMTVVATDNDEGNNAKLEYSIQRSKAFSDKKSIFRIDPLSGKIYALVSS